eukprot:scaffold16_cov147-Skeletonema_menzelii.AAC.3
MRSAACSIGNSTLASYHEDLLLELWYGWMERRNYIFIHSALGPNISDHKRSRLCLSRCVADGGCLPLVGWRRMLLHYVVIEREEVFVVWECRRHLGQRRLGGNTHPADEDGVSSRLSLDEDAQTTPYTRTSSLEARLFVSLIIFNCLTT